MARLSGYPGVVKSAVRSLRIVVADDVQALREMTGAMDAHAT